MSADTRPMMVAVIVPDGLKVNASDFVVCTPERVTLPSPYGEGETRDGYRALSTHRSLKRARAAVSGVDSGMVASFYYGGPDEVLLAEPFSDGTDPQYPDLHVKDACSLEDAEARLSDVSCDRCGAFNDDGEGYDGLCGNCADKAYAANEWGDFDEEEE